MSYDDDASPDSATAFAEDVVGDSFDVTVELVWVCWEPRVCARNRAISLSVKPTGTGSTGCGSGSTVAADGDEGGSWSATISRSLSGF